MSTDDNKGGDDEEVVEFINKIKERKLSESPPKNVETEIKQLDSSIVNVITKDSPKEKLLNKIMNDQVVSATQQQQSTGAVGDDGGGGGGDSLVDNWDDLCNDSGEIINADLLNKLNNLTINNKKETISNEPLSNKKSPPPSATAAATAPSAKKEPNRTPRTTNKNEMIINYLKFPTATESVKKSSSSSSPPGAAASSAIAAAAAKQQLDDEQVAADSNEFEDYGHVIEIYEFPLNFKNENLYDTFREALGHKNFDFKWVDDTHCLGVFSNENDAKVALNVETGILKTRPIHKATEESKRKAKRTLNNLKPYKERPQTTSFVASRLIGASLGLNISKEKLSQEKKKIENARDKRQKEKNLKEAIWNGDV